MTDRPMIFSAPMVQALIDGRKTQTRRLLKGIAPEERIRETPFYRSGLETTHGREVRPPFAPGDRLWVRETWCADTFFDEMGAPPRDIPRGARVWFRADPQGIGPGIPGAWRSPIHMPRWVSRLTLTVTGVRVQRVQEITEDDAVAEGIYRTGPTVNDIANGCLETDAVFHAPGVPQGWGMTAEERRRDQWWPDPINAFRCLWNSIHGPEAWGRNPWVAAATFTVERRNIDEGLSRD